MPALGLVVLASGLFVTRPSFPLNTLKSRRAQNFVMDSLNPRMRAMTNPMNDSEECLQPYPKHFPSAIGFPPCWNNDHLCELAYLVGYDGMDNLNMIRKLKQKFPVLQQVSIHCPFTHVHAITALL